MLEDKNSKNIVIYDLVFEDKDFSDNKKLLVCKKLDRDFIVVEAVKFIQRDNHYFY